MKSTKERITSEIDNEFIERLMNEVVSSINSSSYDTESFKYFISIIKQSTCDIDSYEGFNGRLFWDIADWIKESSGQCKKKQLYHYLCKTFMTVHKHIPEKDIFTDVNNMTISILESKKTVAYLNNEYICRDKTFLFKRTSKGPVTLNCLNYDNAILANIMAEWIDDYNKSAVKKDIGVHDFIESFEESLGYDAQAIKSVYSLSGSTFRKQIAFYKNRFKSNQKKKYLIITLVVSLYRYIVIMLESV